ncbi:MAG: SDR family oxidoreductase [Verrucomicrobia bacterium]|nr:SDR family oxidoreductase [Verrucomicrobiota bacterium]
MTALLSGKTVIITGTNRGIGRAMLGAFSANGANVIAHARRRSDQFEETIASIQSAHGNQIVPAYFDLTDYQAMKAFVTKLLVEKTPVDALVNNAGITHNVLFQMTTADDLRQQFEVNLFAVFFLTQQISRLMSRRKTGSIVNIASSAGLDGNVGKAGYGAAKAAVICMTRAIAAELGASGIRANAIAPGITETEMLATMPDSAVQAVVNGSDLRRMGQPREIANVAVFLASDLSSFVTGQVIRVDGGLK